MDPRTSLFTCSALVSGDGFLERGVFICSALVSSCLFRVWFLSCVAGLFRLMDFRTRYIHRYQVYFVYTFKGFSLLWLPVST